MEMTMTPDKVKNILIVEDDVEIQEFLEDIIESLIPKENLALDIVNDGKEGIKKTVTQKYDLIITDISMPNINGVDFIRQTYWNAVNENTPTLVVSGHLQSFNDKLGKTEFSQLQFVEKPVKAESLSRLIKLCLKI